MSLMGEKVDGRLEKCIKPEERGRAGNWQGLEIETKSSQRVNRALVGSCQETMQGPCHVSLVFTHKTVTGRVHKNYPHPSFIRINIRPRAQNQCPPPAEELFARGKVRHIILLCVFTPPDRISVC